MDEWKTRLAAADNHWLDGLIGCAVAASINGVILPGAETPVRRRRRYTLKELWEYAN